MFHTPSLEIAFLLSETQGILGYSEGATTAATLILEERRRCESEGRPRRIKVSRTSHLVDPLLFSPSGVRTKELSRLTRTR